jgi:hypothetical protein
MTNSLQSVPRLKAAASIASVVGQCATLVRTSFVQAVPRVTKRSAKESIQDPAVKRHKAAQQTTAASPKPAGLSPRTDKGTKPC